MPDPRTDLTAVAAGRLARPSWRDPRLVAGVLLVLASVVLGVRVVAAADDTSPFYAAARPLTPGDAVGADDVQVIHVRLPDPGRYLPATQDLPADLVAVRSVGAGELLARSGVGDRTSLELKPVGVPVEGVLPAGLVKGALVDLWVSRPDPVRAGVFTEPEQLVAAATVAEVAESAGALGSGGTATVQVLVTDTALRSTLGALANGADVALVVLPGGGVGD